MSGGHWQYVGAKVRDSLELVGCDTEARAEWPITAAAFSALATPLYEAAHEMEWALSGDTGTESVEDIKLFHTILHALLAVAPDAWFPRGKWATIQAIQGRVDGR